MTHVMAKGANIALPVAAVRAVLRWSATPGAPDVDASALLLGADGRVRSDADFVFYNQPRHPSGLVRHLPKQHTAGGAEIADTIEVELAKLPPEIDKVVLAGSSERGSFRSVTGLRVLIHDAAAGEGAPALAEFAVGDGDEVTALLAGELYRRAGAWKFRAVGQGYASGLIGLATDFGITVDDAAEAAAAPSAPVDPRTQPGRPAPRPEPGTYTLAPAVPMTPQAQPVTPPPPSAPPAAPPAPPAPPAPQPGYGYPPRQPQPAAQGGYGYPPPAPPQPAYGYPHQQPQQPYPPQQPPQGYPQQSGGYGYPPPAPRPPAPLPQAPQPAVDDFALPPQGPQFQPR